MLAELLYSSSKASTPQMSARLLMLSPVQVHAQQHSHVMYPEAHRTVDPWGTCLHVQQQAGKTQRNAIA
jgi:hypothetical protein